jgi:RNA polymerase sigma factor (sigma-70 family)
MHDAATDRLIVDHMKLSGAIADACYSEFELAGVISYPEVLAYARQGLVEAARRYSPEAGAAFSTFSWFRIRGAVIDGVRKAGRSRDAHSFAKQARASAEGSHVPANDNAVGLFAQSDISVEELPSDDSLAADAQLDARRIRAALAIAVKRLPDLERKVVELVFYEGLNQSEVALRLGIHRSYASKLKMKALEILARELGDSGVEYMSGQAGA